MASARQHQENQKWRQATRQRVFLRACAVLAAVESHILAAGSQTGAVACWPGGTGRICACAPAFIKSGIANSQSTNGGRLNLWANFRKCLTPPAPGNPGRPSRGARWRVLHQTRTSQGPSEVCVRGCIHTPKPDFTQTRVPITHHPSGAAACAIANHSYDAGEAAQVLAPRRPAPRPAALRPAPRRCRLRRPIRARGSRSPSELHRRRRPRRACKRVRQTRSRPPGRAA